MGCEEEVAPSRSQSRRDDATDNVPNQVPEGERHDYREERSRRFLILVVLLVICCWFLVGGIVGIITGVFIANRSADDCAEPPRNTQSPSMAPSPGILEGPTTPCKNDPTCVVVVGEIDPVFPPNNDTDLLPSLPPAPSVPCQVDPACQYVMDSIEPVYPWRTRALLNSPGSCQNYARDRLLSITPDIQELLPERIRQRFALVLVYCEWGGDNWLDAGDLWLSELHECDWFTSIGVDPCGRRGQYQILRLPEQNLKGTLPPELSLMPTLWELTLSNNQLSGTIPPELKELSGLDTLSLSSNTFNGLLPDLMWKFYEITFLDLGDNFFAGTIPEGVYLDEPSLAILFLQQNDISSSIPTDFGKLNWRRLHLYSNKLEGEIPSDIHAPEMEELLLHNNRLSGEFPYRPFAEDIPTGKSLLTSVTLYKNDIRGSVDEMCPLMHSGSLTLFEVDVAKVACSCCNPNP